MAQRRNVTPAARLEALRHHAVTRSPFYRRVLQGLDDAPLDQLPVLDKRTFVDRYDELVVDRRVTLRAVEEHVAVAVPGSRFLGRYEVGATSGSTGRPSILLFDDHEWAGHIAGFARGTRFAGPLPLPRGTRPRSARLGSAAGWLTSNRMGGTIRDPRRPWRNFDVFRPLDDVIGELAAWRPHILSGYPSRLRALADAQLDGRLTISPRRIITSGEVLVPETRARIVEAWGTEPFDRYIATETGLIAAECSAHRGMHVLDDVVLEAVDEDRRPVRDGEMSSALLVTVLDSRTLPLLRYELADRVCIDRAACPCGRTSARIVRIEGRQREVLRFVTPAGVVTVPPGTFGEIFHGTGVGAWQVAEDRGSLELRVVEPRPGFDPELLRRRVLHALARHRVTDAPVSVAVVPALEVGPGGKVPVITSTSADGDLV